MRKPKILVVDDEPDVRQRLSNIISKRIDSDVETAASGEEALEKLKQEAFDLALLDIKMPGLSGIDVIKKAAQFTPRTKIVVITGYDSEEIASEALKHGAVDYLTKPQTPESLVLKLKSILAQKDKLKP